MCSLSRSRRWKLLACAIAGVMLAACSGGSSPSGAPRITPPPEPTPTPEQSPWSSGWPKGGLDENWEVLREIEGELWSACYDGTPVPGAAPYGGKVHPLVVVDTNNAWLAYDVEINEGFRVGGWPWPTPIQLVVCARHDEKVIGSCGLYKTKDGEVGEVLRSRDKVTFRVVVAETGETLQTKVVSAPAPRCPNKLWAWTPADRGWTLTNPVSVEQIDKYATAVSKQEVK